MTEHATSEPERSPRRRPKLGINDEAMRAALDEEFIDFESAVATAAMWAAVVGLFLSVLVTVLFDGTFGGPLIALSLAFLLFFAGLRALIRRGASSFAFRLGQHIAEGLIPAGTLLVLNATAGAVYALSSWVPPMLILLTIALSAVRLQRWLPVVTAVASSGFYLAVYFFVFAAESLPSSPLFAPRMQFTRAVSIVLMGIVAGLVADRLRGVLTRAGGRARAKELFGKYRLGENIAHGGMGVVTHATYCPEGGFERPVAMKRVHPHLVQNPRVVESFRAEAEIGAKLQHPNIVATLDFGRADETYFLAMEYVDGEDLARLLQRLRLGQTPLAQGTVVKMAREIIAALDYAHTRVVDLDGSPLRVIHRDLSPANVLVAKRGTLKLIDFGVARALRQGERHHTEHLAGKLAYMAPEQVHGLDVDERSDLYAFGLILYELLTLESAQGRDNDAAIVTEILEGDVKRPCEIRKDLAPEWDALVGKLLAKKPADRFQSARDVDRELAALEDRWPVADDEHLDQVVQRVSTLDLATIDVDSTIPGRRRPVVVGAP